MRDDQLRSAGELIVAALLAMGEPLPDERLTALAASEWRSLPAAARHHGAAPALYLALRGSEAAPPEVLRLLGDEHTRTTRFHLRAWTVLTELTALLDEAAIPYVTFKGPVLAERLYPRPDLRPYGDVDLLVAPAQFERALRLAESTGAVVIEQNWELVLHLLKGELNVLHPTYVAIDLHWSLLYDETLRKQFGWSDRPFLERAVERTILGRSLRCLDPVDELLHLCLHACLGGGHRLAWLQDIRLAAERPEIDWDEFERRARTAHVALPVAVVLERASRVFGTSTAPAVGAGRAGDAVWLTVVETLDRLRPPAAWRSRRLSGHVIVAGTRSDRRGSFVAAAQGVKRALGELAHDPSHPWRAGDLGQGRNPMLEPRLGPAGREAYLRAVGRQHLG